MAVPFEGKRKSTTSLPVVIKVIDISFGGFTLVMKVSPQTLFFGDENR